MIAKLQLCRKRVSEKNRFRTILSEMEICNQSTDQMFCRIFEELEDEPENDALKAKIYSIS
jgi:hypothetical protein